MKKYPTFDADGNIRMAGSIGVNHYNAKINPGFYASSYNETFDSTDFVQVEGGMVGSLRYCSLGDISEAYEILNDILRRKNPQTIFEIAACVQETILKYFGDYSNASERLSYFISDEEIAGLYEEDGVVLPTDEQIESKRGRVSNIAHKNAAGCVERAMVSQNLLKYLGIDSIYKASMISIDGVDSGHAYNLIAYQGKYYVFDATIPCLRDEIISPIIAEIPKETFDRISNPSSYVGEGVHAIHYNPLRDIEYDITYDSKREDIYEVESPYTI